jgi:glutaconate CoA-transferase subunit B
MSQLADVITTLLTREFITAARDRDVRVIAVTSMSSLVAALAAQRLGALQLAVAPGFCTLDAPATPSLSLGEVALRTAESSRGPLSDTFVALARGRVGVVVSPAQLDARGATNLSRIGGSDAAPGVALPGSRGLPDNNDSPSQVWYLFSTHSPRHLVQEVDFESGPPPSPGRIRRLLTPLGLFELSDGWSSVALAPGVTSEQLQEATGFTIDVAADCPEITAPTADELRVLEQVDPENLRGIEFLAGPDAAARFAEVVRREASGN